MARRRGGLAVGLAQAGPVLVKHVLRDFLGCREDESVAVRYVDQLASIVVFQHVAKVRESLSLLGNHVAEHLSLLFVLRAL